MALDGTGRALAIASGTGLLAPGRLATEADRPAGEGPTGARAANADLAVHRSDAARLFRLAIEQAPAGAILHAVGEEGVPVREVAALIADRLGVPITSIDPADEAEHFGFLGGLLSADMPASSARTRELLGWEPTGLGLLEDMAAHYLGGR